MILHDAKAMRDDPRLADKIRAAESVQEVLWIVEAFQDAGIQMPGTTRQIASNRQIELHAAGKFKAT